jgi:glycosyltransferase involved in cell wall biosynthesis
VNPRVALAHDYLLVMRGAERTFAAMADCWPAAPIYTLLYDERGTGRTFDGHAVHTSYLQHLGAKQANFRRLLPLFPHAVARLDVGDVDVLVSSSSAFAHGVPAPRSGLHVCYCHSPFRYAWHERARALAEVPAPARPILRAVLPRIRAWDLRAARGVTHFLANSQITQERIFQLWGRESTIVHPPVEVERFVLEQPEDYFLVVSEIVAHKRIELAIEAARLAGRRVKVVGTGPDLERLKATYGETADFLGRVKDSELMSLYARSCAVIVPNVEEFGIAAVEAQAAGRPVVALDTGGTAETVVDGDTGVLVPEQTAESFAEALGQTDFERFSSIEIRRHAATNFSTARFMRQIRAEVERVARHETADPRV